MHLIYTSGTTGRPKGVMRSHRGDIAIAQLMATELGLIVSDRLQLMMPVFHVGARFLQMGMHLRGGCVVFHREFRAVEIVEAIAREKVTMTHMAPTMVQAMLDAPNIETADLSSLHTSCYSAAPMPGPVLQRGLKLLGPVFLQLYGMTEGGGTTLHKRQHKPDGTAQDIKRLGSIGQAAPNVGVKIVDAEGQELQAVRRVKSSRARRATWSATGTTARLPSRPCATAGIIRATLAIWTTRGSCTWSTARKT